MAVRAKMHFASETLFENLFEDKTVFKNFKLKVSCLVVY